MIPGPIAVGPAAPPRRTRRPVRPGVLIGLLLVVGGVAGSVLWLTALSPYGFKRFPLAEADRTLEVKRAGTYVVFEEFPGASDRQLPAPLDVTVLSLDGHAVAVETLTTAGSRRPVDAYAVPLHEGRAVARFDAPRPGRYLLRVRVKEPGTYAANDFAPTSDAIIALGPDLATTWLGSPWVGLGLGPLLFGVGVVVIVVTLGRRPGPAQTDGGPPAVSA